MNKEKRVKSGILIYILVSIIIVSGCNRSGGNDHPDKLHPAIVEHVDTSIPQGKEFLEVTIPNTEVRKLKSAFTGTTYEIDLFIPPGYEKDTTAYPVVFVLDAEYNFGCVAYITRRLIKNGDIPNVILAGIAYESDDEEAYYDIRMRDCTPPSHIHGYHTGGVENFISFFTRELIPFVNSNYRTQTDNYTITGHSIGGFFCGYALFNHPGIFRNYIIVSPSFWFSDEVIFKYEKTYAENHTELDATVFLATGADESERMVQTTDRFIATMHQQNFHNFHFRYMIPGDEHHRSIFPYAYTKGLQYIFEKP